jgi:hypothetical protein
MENTGAGENERKKEKSNMAAHSKRSQKGEKPSTKQTKKPTTPAEAAELLTSALSYCKDAGLIVAGYNEGATLILEIDGLQYAGEKIQVTLIGVTGVTR